MLMSGGSRGIGPAIAVVAARRSPRRSRLPNKPWTGSAATGLWPYGGTGEPRYGVFAGFPQ
ncbi:hypothetical protein C3486_03205 [Streptomyces sp. Ru73]|nr:hypothetical protein C3486_03205 [Streptomyces sp. Ru73]